MYDALTSRYTFSCPRHGESRVALSAFRTLEPLAGTAHPVVYCIRFACPCGDEHDGLVSHDELDWAPLGLEGGVFLNLMTSRVEPVASEFGELAAARIGAGEWPWSFFCYPEEKPRPVFPSSFLVLAPGDGSVGLAVRCPACLRTCIPRWRSSGPSSGRRASTPAGWGSNRPGARIAAPVCAAFPFLLQMLRRKR